MKSIYGDQELIDIGYGVGIAFWRVWQPDGKGPIGGIIEEHPDKRDPSKRCAGSITFKGYGKEGKKVWDVVSMEPLTLSPSLLCTVCGNHGFIRDGKWIPS